MFHSHPVVFTSSPPLHLRTKTQPVCPKKDLGFKLKSVQTNLHQNCGFHAFHSFPLFGWLKFFNSPKRWVKLAGGNMLQRWFWRVWPVGWTKWKIYTPADHENGLGAIRTENLSLRYARLPSAAVGHKHTVTEKRIGSLKWSDKEQVPLQNLKQSRGVIRMVMGTAFHGLVNEEGEKQEGQPGQMKQQSAWRGQILTYVGWQ